MVESFSLFLLIILLTKASKITPSPIQDPILPLGQARRKLTRRTKWCCRVSRTGSSRRTCSVTGGTSVCSQDSLSTNGGEENDSFFFPWHHLFSQCHWLLGLGMSGKRCPPHACNVFICVPPSLELLDSALLPLPLHHLFSISSPPWREKAGVRCQLTFWIRFWSHKYGKNFDFFFGINGA